VGRFNRFRPNNSGKFAIFERKADAAQMARSTRYEFRSFQETRRFARNLGLSSRSEWRRYCASPQRPVDIPTNPQVAYRSEWKEWADFLGTSNTKNSFLPFWEAQPLARSLELPNMAAYRAAAHHKLPAVYIDRTLFRI